MGDPCRRGLYVVRVYVAGDSVSWGVRVVGGSMSWGVYVVGGLRRGGPVLRRRDVDDLVLTVLRVVVGRRRLSSRILRLERSGGRQPPTLGVIVLILVLTLTLLFTREQGERPTRYPHTE